MATDPISGVGLGLRACHYQHILSAQPAVPWFEVMTDNYMGAGGQPHHYLHQIAEHYPLTFHGVGLSLGSVAPLDTHYLDRLAELIERYQPAWVSEHLSWSHNGQYNSHDLLPMPYTEAAVQHMSDRISQVQERLGQRILVENLSSYATFAESEMTEWEYVAEICQRADCDLLLDINNVHVSAMNHGFDPHTYVAGLPLSRVREVHLAGYEQQGALLLDSHSAPVHQPVWQLYRQLIEQIGPVPTLIEWDNHIPAFEVLMQEARKAEQICQEVADAA